MTGLPSFFYFSGLQIFWKCPVFIEGQNPVAAGGGRRYFSSDIFTKGDTS